MSESSRQEPSGSSPTSTPHDTTSSVSRAEAPVSAKDGEMVEQVYSVLHKLAEGCLGWNSRMTLQPTALVNEAWLRLAKRPDGSLNDRDHFLTLASKVMRQVLVDYARSRDALKRGAGWGRVTLSESSNVEAAYEMDLVSLDSALHKLGKLNPSRLRLVELRYFAGLSLEQAAETTGISRAEAARQWRSTKAWLASEIRSEQSP